MFAFSDPFSPSGRKTEAQERAGKLTIMSLHKLRDLLSLTSCHCHDDLLNGGGN